ncbi:MAG: hypothetical protein KF900_10170 [Bacteroidetes bacterium]|nr:hypothetical protein [Bacteroidota bacterium]
MKKILFLFFTFLIFSCDKKNQQANNNPVPSVPVNIVFYPNDPLYQKLQWVGGWVYIDGGINGIVVYRKSQEEFVAVERTSSYAPNNSAAKVQVMNDNFTLRDTISNSRWRIFDGTVTQGPAEWALRLYGTSYDGNMLRILN